MKMSVKLVVAALSAVGVVIGALATHAEETSGAQQQAAPQAESYQPSLSDIMAHQQERHIKLWFAGRAGNWPLADYEIGELSDGFDDVGNMLGGNIVKQHVGAPLAALQTAVGDKNSAAFAAAYDSLSAGCNACHHTLDHAFIVIARPALLPFSDQVFAPQK
jgi:hypothetical protein